MQMNSENVVVKVSFGGKGPAKDRGIVIIKV